MALDLAAIRRRLSQISGQNKTRDAFWKPDQDVTYNIRVLPFKDNDGQPFKERYFYYGIGKNPGLLTPHQFGKKDPIQDLIDKLRADGSPESREMAKRLYPKMRAYAAVLVRGEEDKGPRLWSFGKNVYQLLLNVILDEDYGDITDPLEGRDIKVIVTKPQGATYAKTEVMPKPKQTALSDDQKLAAKWLDSIPDLDAITPLKSSDELERIINEWVATGGEEGADEGEGTSRGASQQKTVVKEDLVEEVEAEVESKTSKVEKPAKKAAKTHKDIDDAFNDIITDGD